MKPSYTTGTTYTAQRQATVPKVQTVQVTSTPTNYVYTTGATTQSPATTYNPATTYQSATTATTSTYSGIHSNVLLLLLLFLCLLITEDNVACEHSAVNLPLFWWKSWKKYIYIVRFGQTVLFFTFCYSSPLFSAFWQISYIFLHNFPFWFTALLTWSLITPLYKHNQICTEEHLLNATNWKCVYKCPPI